MSLSYNIIVVNAGGTAYPTILLPPDCIGGNEDREAFIEYGDGHEPTVVRVWMTRAQIEALPVGVATGATKCGFTIECNSYGWTSPGSLSLRTLNTQNDFTLLRTTPMVGSVNLETTVYEVIFVSHQYQWWYNGVDINFNLLTEDKLSLVAKTAISSSHPYAYQDISDSMSASVGLTVGAWGTIPTATNNSEYPFNVVASSVSPFLNRFYGDAGSHLVWSPWTGSYTIAAFNASDTVEGGQLSALANVALYSGQIDDPNTYSNYLPGHIRVNVSQIDRPNVGATNISRYTNLGSLDFTAEYTIAELPSGTSVPGTATLHIGSHFGGGNTNAASAGAGGNNADANKSYYPTYENWSNIASWRVANLAARCDIIETTVIFVGAYPILPGSTVRRVRISLDSGDNMSAGCFTTVWRHPFEESGIMSKGGAACQLGVISYPSGICSQFFNNANLYQGSLRFDNRSAMQDVDRLNIYDWDCNFSPATHPVIKAATELQFDNAGFNSSTNTTASGGTTAALIKWVGFDVGTTASPCVAPGAYGIRFQSGGSSPTGTWTAAVRFDVSSLTNQGSCTDTSATCLTIGVVDAYIPLVTNCVVTCVSFNTNTCSLTVNYTTILSIDPGSAIFPDCSTNCT